MREMHFASSSPLLQSESGWDQGEVPPSKRRKLFARKINMTDQQRTVCFFSLPSLCEDHQPMQLSREVNKLSCYNIGMVKHFIDFSLMLLRGFFMLFSAILEGLADDTTGGSRECCMF